MSAVPKGTIIENNDEEQQSSLYGRVQERLAREFSRLLLIGFVTAFLNLLPIPLGSSIRFTLGIVFFALTSVLWRDISMLSSSIMTMLTISFVNACINLSMNQPILFDAVFFESLGILLSLLCFSGIIFILDLREQNIDFTGFYARIFIGDVLSSLVDIIIRDRSALQSMPQYELLIMVGFVALFRAALVVTFYYIAQRERIDVSIHQEKEKYEQLLMLLTGFYTEAFFLRKSSADIESTMARCYALYRSLSEREATIENGHALTLSALDVAKDIHEIKKDYQRIIAGMNRLIKLDTVGDRLPFRDLVQMIVSSNQSYSIQLKKNITFTYQPGYRFLTSEIHSLISMLNNLVSNAVEAIDHDEGTIAISSQLVGWYIYLTVKDNGPGIRDEDQQIIFAPGYTTKFSGSGQQSTGIGLTHVQSIAQSLGGEVRIHSMPGDTVFTLVFPRERIECPPDEPMHTPPRAGNVEITLKE